MVLGAGSPQAISRALLCGVCMFPPCSQGVSSTKNPNRKNMQKNRTLSCPSLTKTDGSVDLVDGKFVASKSFSSRSSWKQGFMCGVSLHSGFSKFFTIWTHF